MPRVPYVLPVIIVRVINHAWQVEISQMPLHMFAVINFLVYVNFL